MGVKKSTSRRPGKINKKYARDMAPNNVEVAVLVGRLLDLDDPAAAVVQSVFEVVCDLVRLKTELAPISIKKGTTRNTLCDVVWSGTGPENAKEMANIKPKPEYLELLGLDALAANPAPDDALACVVDKGIAAVHDHRGGRDHGASGPGSPLQSTTRRGGRPTEA